MFIPCCYFRSVEDIADAGVYGAFDKSKQSLRQSSSEPAQPIIKCNRKQKHDF